MTDPPERLLRQLERGVGPPRADMLRAHLLRSIETAQSSVRSRRPEPLTPKWIAERRSGIIESLGVERVPVLDQPKDTLVRELERRDFVIEKRLVEVIDDLPLPVDVYRPLISDPSPLVLHVPGHWMENGRLHADFQRNAIALTRSGMTVAMYDPIDEGERFVDWRAHSLYAMVAAGISFFGLLLAEARALLRLLMVRSDIDQSRVGVTGASGGGQTAMFFPIVDENVRAIVPVCYACDLGKLITRLTRLNYVGGADLCPQMIGLADEVTYADIIGLAAPVPACYINASEDQNFPPEDAELVVEDARRYYEACGAEAVLELVAVPGGHAYGWNATEVACRFFRRVFDRGLSSSVRSGEPQLPCEDSELQKVPYAVDFMSVSAPPDRIDRLPTQSPDWDQETRVLPEGVDGRRGSLAIAQRIASKAGGPGAASRDDIWNAFGLYSAVSARPPNILRSWEIDGVCIERLVLEPEEGVELPLLLFVPERYDGFAAPLILLSQDGMLDAVEVFDVSALIAAGWAVVACEPRGYGETAGVEFEVSTTALLLRRHLFAQRAGDLRAAIEYVSSRIVVGIQLDPSRLTLAAADAETALLALVVAATDVRVAGLYAREHYRSWSDLLVTEPSASPVLYVPGAAGHMRLEDLALASGGPALLGARAGSVAAEQPGLLEWLAAADAS